MWSRTSSHEAPGGTRPIAGDSLSSDVTPSSTVRPLCWPYLCWPWLHYVNWRWPRDRKLTRPKVNMGKNSAGILGTGTTRSVGVEEELLLVDSATGQARAVAAAVMRAADEPSADELE